MTDDKIADHTADDDGHETGIARALSESKRLERDERDAALSRQAEADERIVRALSKD